MKFWVKAVVDSKVSEQLHLQADSIDELRDSLAQMLHIPIASLSITDFQSQVVDRLRTGVEIITVWIHSQSADTVFPEHPSHASTPRRDARPGSFHGRSSTGSHPALALTPKSTLREIDGSFRDEDSMSGVFDAHGNFQTSSQPLSHRASWRERGTPRDDVVTESPSASLFPTREPIREPCVAKLCLTRDDLLILLDQRHHFKYTPEILGCFVRAKEADGYGFYQVTDIVDGDIPLILLDTVYSSDSRQLDTISNAAPTSGEVRAWFRKMLSAARQIPSFATVEAKYGDMASHLSAARSVLGLGSQTTGSALGDPLLSTQHPSHAAGPAEPVSPPISPVRHEATVVVPTPDSATPCRKEGAAPSTSSTLGFFQGSSVVRTNDQLEGRGATLAPSLHANGSEDSPQFSLFVRRRANTLSKKGLRTDLAMCVMQLDVDGRVTSDVDVAPKGLHFFGVPVLWKDVDGRADTFVALAEPSDRNGAGWGRRRSSPARFGALHVGPNSAPFTDEGSGRLVQSFQVLRGPVPDCLRWKGEATALLPLPMWAQNEGHDPRILSPTLVVSGAILHAFYVVLIHVDQPSVYRPQLGSRRVTLVGGKDSPGASNGHHIDPTSVSPLSLRGSSVATGVSPQHRRHSSLVARLDATPFADDAGGDDVDCPGVAPHEGRGPSPTSPLSSTDDGERRSSEGDHTRKFALAHAYTTDAGLQSWTIVNNREPIVYAFDEPPVYTAFVYPGASSAGTPASRDGNNDDGTSPSGEDSSAETATTLGLAWWDRSCGSLCSASHDAGRQRSSGSRLPLLCFAYRPVEPPPTDLFNRSRRGSALDWVPVVITTPVPCTALFEEAESISLTTIPSQAGEPCFLLSVVGRSRCRTPGTTFHTPVWSLSVALTGR